MKHYLTETEQVLSSLGTSRQGLSDAQAQERLFENGKNLLRKPKGKSLLRRFLEQLKDPMILILIAAATVSGLLSIVENESFADVIIILAVVIINSVLGVYQESKAEKAIEALQQMSAATAKVIRDGRIRVIACEDVVVGDVLVLEAGDAVAADARVIESNSLQTEEAALTGESVPIYKQTAPLSLPDEQKDVTLGDRKNMVYTGSTVVFGRGLAVVTAIGMDTEMGKIASALNQAEQRQTPLQEKLASLSRILTFLVLGICAAVFAIQLFRTGEFALDPILDSFMIAVSLAVAAIPEGLAAVVTVVLSIGVTNMSRRGAIIRRLTAVETLGCAQIICSDKTGTLTQNKMTVTDCYCEDDTYCALGMSLCCDAQYNEDGTVTGEPTEAALVSWAHTLGLRQKDTAHTHPRIGEAPFDSGRKMMSTVHRCDDGALQFTKGAPEVLLSRCTHVYENGAPVPITEQTREKIIAAGDKMSARALRVLALAQRRYDAPPDSFSPEVLEEGLCFVGLCGMIDPVRDEVAEAIAECRKAGIRPIMITGDHVDTATAIAKELSLFTGDSIAMTGAELDELSDEEFEDRFRRVCVYARVRPEHKTRIVNAWKNAGYITAMTGDGVNDAPSIKSADIGVGMGITGTDVTKNVADMVLTDDNFATIVSAVEEGRRIYDNIRKCIQFLLSSNLSEVISIFTATLLGFTILKPVHLLWINLVTDTFPALALGMEKSERDVMQRPPRDPKQGVFADKMGADILFGGFVLSLLTLGSFFLGHLMQFGTVGLSDSSHGVTMAFLTLSFAEIFHSFNLRSRDKSIFTLKGHNKVLWIAAIGSLLCTTLVCEVPFLADAFGFVQIGLSEYAVATGLGLLIIPLNELYKLFLRRRTAQN